MATLIQGNGDGGGFGGVKEFEVAGGDGGGFVSGGQR